MNATELARVIESVGKDRGIKKEIIIGALEQAILTAAQKKHGPNSVLEAHYNNDTGEIDLFLFKKVVDSDDEMLEQSEEIKIEEAKKLDPDADIGDEIGVKVDAPDFGRIDAQTAKQVIFQKVRDAEMDIVYNEYIKRKGEITTGIARRIEKGSLMINIGKTDALLPRSEVIPGETFRVGDRVQAYLSDVVLTNRGPQVYLSRVSPKYVEKLFEMEVPEVREGIVQVKGCVREAGARTKIAVTSSDRDIDPVGACVGMNGVRVKAIIQELKGEKIDIIPWSDSPVIFVRSSLTQAEISSVKVDEDSKTMEIMIEDDKLSLAIGKKGQNVRLAAQLTGWKLDIISKSKLQKRTQEAIFNLQHISGVNETLAHAIYNAGMLNVKQIADADIESLIKIPGFEDKESAERLKKNAVEIIDKAGDMLSGESDSEDDSEGRFSADPSDTKQKNKGDDIKALAEKRLKESIEKSKEKSDK